MRLSRHPPPPARSTLPPSTHRQSPRHADLAVGVPAPDRHRTTVRRGGFTSHDGAEAALRTFLEGEAGGFNADPDQTVADYLNIWLAAKALVLKPTTMARYRDYLHNDLVPAFGSLKLDELRHRHISAFVTGQLAASRGRTTLYRCLATLSSALGDTVRQHRLAHNPASPPALRRPPAPERRIWTANEAVRFLQHCHHADPETADLFDNNHLVITPPKTRSSKNWVTISPRVAAAPPAPRALQYPHPQRPEHPLQRTGLLPTRRPATAQRCAGPTPGTLRRSGRSPGDRSRSAPPGRRPHHHRRRPPHRGLQDPAPLHPVDHHATTSNASARPSTGSAPCPARLVRHREPVPNPACDHTATTSPPGTRKAALP
ncbi:hypothetical protein K4749_02575 [Streptomyces sp. TRM72054]|nr:hypothetical protein [Streptomyces sp. TRM72054]